MSFQFKFWEIHIGQFTISPTAASTICHPFGTWTKPKHLLAEAALTGFGSIVYWLGEQALQSVFMSSNLASDTWCGHIFRKVPHSLCQVSHFTGRLWRSNRVATPLGLLRTEGLPRMLNCQCWNWKISGKIEVSWSPKNKLKYCR